jgi:uncharacterized protein (TIRG00374 family)
MKTISFLKKYLFPTAIGLVFIYFLFKTVNFRESYSYFTGIEPFPLFMSLLLYFLQYFLLAVRWKILVRGDIGIAPLFAVTSIHNMTNNVMPFRTGEAAFPYLMKKYYGVGLGDSTAYLIYARTFDMLAVVVFFLVSLLFSYKSVFDTFGGIGMDSIRFILYLALLIVAVLILYAVFGGLSKSEAGEESPFQTGVRTALRSLVKGMKDVEVLKIVSKLSISSLAVFLARYTFFMYALATFGIELPFYRVITAATMAILAAVFPVQGAGGFGTIETGWVMGFVLIGMDKEPALMAGLGTHTIRLVFSLIFATLTFPVLKSCKKTGDKQ